MTVWLADENFRAEVLRGVSRRAPSFEVITVESLGLRSSADDVILERAAAEGWVLLTHDEETMPGFAYGRLTDGLSMPGVVVVPWTLNVGRAVEEIEVLELAGRPGDFDGKVEYLPL
ncbi:MAG: DUF5615 family PIN-like protein [Dehalococcoidia bacterium]